MRRHRTSPARLRTRKVTSPAPTAGPAPRGRLVTYRSTPARPGFVYFIECDGFIKIGFSLWPRARLEALQPACPHPMRLVGTLRGKSSKDERRLHKRFAALRVRPRQEWFRDEPELRDFIATHARSV